MRSLHISLNTTHSGCKPSSFISSLTHSLQVFLPLPAHLTPATTTFLQADTQSSPLYIRNMLTSVTELPGRSHLRSAASGLHDVPGTRTKFGTRSFSVAGPTAWNALPLELRATGKTENFSSRFMVLTLIHAKIKVDWPYCKFDIDLIVRRRWPGM